MPYAPSDFCRRAYKSDCDVKFLQCGLYPSDTHRIKAMCDANRYLTIMDINPNDNSTPFYEIDEPKMR